MIMCFLKKQRIVSISLAIIITVGLVSIVAVNSAADPGSGEDPVVSQSYVDSKIETLTKSLQTAEQKIEILSKSLQTAEQKIEILSKSTQASVQKFEVVEVKLGKSVICGDSTELVVRSGKAKAISSDAGGLSDLTADNGGDLKNGANILTNHLLLIPRDDGRGIKVTSASAWVMIKGKYEIK